MAKKYSTDPFIYVFSRRLVGNLDQKDYSSEVKKIYGFVRDKIRYTRDINNVETIQTPDWTVRIGTGDCDDKTLLFASLALSLGHQVKIRIVGNGTSENYSHVYPMVRIPEVGWVAADGTEPEPLGFTKKVDHIFEVDCLSGFPNKRFVAKASLNSYSIQQLHAHGGSLSDGGLEGSLGKFLKKVGKKVQKAAKKVAPLAIAALPIPGAQAVAAGVGAALKQKAQAKKLKKSQQPLPYIPPDQPLTAGLPEPEVLTQLRNLRNNYDPDLSPTQNLVNAQQGAFQPLVLRELASAGFGQQQAQALAPIVIQSGSEAGIREAVRETKDANNPLSNPLLLGALIGVPILILLASKK